MLLGTNPENGGSFFRADLMREPGTAEFGTLVLEFNTVPGVLYDILESQTLEDWKVESTVLGDGARFRLARPVPVFEPALFHRVRAFP